MSFTPQNATPTVSSGTTTVVVPEFCVFACYGPTPVSVPTAAITPNSGTVAVVRYQGQDYPVGTGNATAPTPSTGVPAGFAGHGCSMLAVSGSPGSDAWLGAFTGGPIRSLDPIIKISHIRCILHDGPLDEADTVAQAPGEVMADGDAALVPPAAAPFTYDSEASELRYCLRMLWFRADEQPATQHVEELCTVPAQVANARLVT